VILLKKGDYFIVLLLIMAGLAWFIRDYVWSNTGNNMAVIEVNGQHYEKLSLNEDTKFKINFPDNKYIELTVENEEIWISEETVDCPEKICVKTGKISRPGESIVCLPNKTVIYIEGSLNNDNQEIDDISY